MLKTLPVDFEADLDGPEIPGHTAESVAYLAQPGGEAIELH